MLRGHTLFVCDECGKHFVGMDIEFQATVLSSPLRCPKCSSWHTMPFTSQLTQKGTYRDIWAMLDKEQQIDDAQLSSHSGSTGSTTSNESNK